MDLNSGVGSYGDQDNDGDQPAECIPLPNDLEIPTFAPPSKGVFSQQRQTKREDYGLIIQKKIAGANTARPVAGPPASSRLPKKANSASTIAGSPEVRYKR